MAFANGWYTDLADKDWKRRLGSTPPSLLKAAKVGDTRPAGAPCCSTAPAPEGGRRAGGSRPQRDGAVRGRAQSRTAAAPAPPGTAERGRAAPGGLAGRPPAALLGPGQGRCGGVRGVPVLGPGPGQGAAGCGGVRAVPVPGVPPRASPQLRPALPAASQRSEERVFLPLTEPQKICCVPRVPSAGAFGRFPVFCSGRDAPARRGRFPSSGAAAGKDEPASASPGSPHSSLLKLTPEFAAPHGDGSAPEGRLVPRAAAARSPAGSCVAATCPLQLRQPCL